MTVQSGGALSRRGGRGPGWLLLTTLLVLAILASSTLVFTNKVELLRLAVILSLWAAVLAAFVTVVYRRQSEVAQARARDMKVVYDLQLDREISARREYELAVEAELRRQLSAEVRAQAADEMAGLRAELASLRSQLEVMLGTDLSHRPALESERVVAPTFSEPVFSPPIPSAPMAPPMSAMPMPPAPDRVESSRVTVVAEEYVAYEETVVESPIIDVPEEPLTPAARDRVAPPAPEPVRTEQFVPDYRGQRRRPEPEPERYVPPAPQHRPPTPPPQPEMPWRPPETRPGRHSNAPAGQPWPEPVAPDPARGRHWVAPEVEAPAGRHRGSLEPEVQAPAFEEPAEPAGQHSAGQSISELLSRFDRSGQVRSGGRRRRED